MCKDPELRAANQADESRQAVELAEQLAAQYGVDALFVTRYKTADNIRAASDHAPVCVSVSLQ